MTSHLAKINNWLWVGNCESCPTFPGPNVIHIFRTDKESTKGYSQERFCKYNRRNNLRVNYKDGEELSLSNLKNINTYIEALKSQDQCNWLLDDNKSHIFHPGDTLIHCHAGACRSPTITVYVLMLTEGIHPIDGQHIVAKSIYDQRNRKVCNIPHRPMKQILQLWELQVKVNKEQESI